MKYYKVSAMNIDRDGFVVKTNEDGSLWVRDEVVDTDNQIFSDCKNEYEVEERYESYWNRWTRNDIELYSNQFIVKVLEVELVSDRGVAS